MNKQLLIDKLFNKFDKEKWAIKELLTLVNEVALTTTENKEKITLIIKIEKGKK